MAFTEMALQNFKKILPLFLSIVLSCAWLLPNHYPPWTSFHSEALAACVLLVVSFMVFLYIKEDIAWSGPAVFLLAISIIPWWQFWVGKIFFFGTAFIYSLFLFGLFVSFLVGYQWERVCKSQCADFIFSAIGVASVISVGIQIYQWLGFEGGVWIINSSRERPFANLGQPNQLGSLLLIGVLAIVRGCAREILHRYFAAFLVAFILFGVALTQSRTALLNSGALFLALWWWAHANLQSKLKWLIVVYAGYFVAIFFVLPHLFVPGSASFVERVSGEPRIKIWYVFFLAVLQNPVGGYGWGQIANAQIEVASPLNFLGGLYTQSHNLILDLFVWNGILVGTLVVAGVAWFLSRVCRMAKRLEILLPLISIVVLLIHSMLEFPLHYAYFLLPAGMLSGATAFSSGIPQLFSTRRLFLTIFVALSFVGTAIVFIDYSRIERSYYVLRAELAKIKVEGSGYAPDVFVLTHMRELIVFARFNPREGMDRVDLDWMQKVAKVFPSPNNFRKVALALAFNGDQAGAKKWLSNICNVFGERDSRIVMEVWVEHSKLNPLVAKVAWPNDCAAK